MTTAPAPFTTKLPKVGTTIFTVMSKMAADHGALNFGQGFPDFEVSRTLIDRVHYHMRNDRNQYCPMQGVPALREQIATKVNAAYGCQATPDEVVVTAGATEALFAAITALVHEGDEVIVLEPAYDCYVPAIELQGGVPVYVSLDADFAIDFTALQAAITERTTAIVVNTPHNPSGTVVSKEAMRQLVDLVVANDLMLFSDEVYEHIIFDGLPHTSALAYPELWGRSLSVFSFGKTFHATGWKVGYAIAAPWIIKELCKVHQYLTFSVNTPVQHALADYLEAPAHYNNLPGFYQQKRDTFLRLIKGSKFEPIPCQGTYFQGLRYDKVSDKGDMAMAEWLTKEHKLASIPLSPFYYNGHDPKTLRFCFAKGEESLEKAAEILCKI